MTNADYLRTISRLSPEELQGWVNMVTGKHHCGRNWQDGEKAAVLQRASELNVRIEGL